MKVVEQTLERLLDYQRFEANADLQRVIDATHTRYAIRGLSLEEMGCIAAAGVPDIPRADRERK